ncbi:hypothetical protein ACLOJK_008800 [Asimina triloba]
MMESSSYRSRLKVFGFNDKPVVSALTEPTQGGICRMTPAQVPPAQQLRGVNQGPVADYVTENRATYREPTISGFSNFLFRLCFYNTTPDGHVFTIRMGSRQGENIMGWVWDANRNYPVRDKHPPPPPTLLLGQSLRMAGASKLVSRTSLEDGSDWALTA